MDDSLSFSAIGSRYAAPTGRAAAPAAAFARCEVHDDLAAARAAWTEMEALAAASPYQSFAFLRAWQETIGRARGVTPMIVVARDAAGRVNAVLPLGRSRRGLIQAAEFLGGAHANFRMGLFRPGLAPSSAAIRNLLTRAARLAAPRVDAFWLANQPLSWQGVANPMAVLAGRPSPSYGYKTALTGDFDLWLRSRHAGETRKKIRKKLLRLNDFGPVSHVVAKDEAMVRRILDAFMVQKRAQLASAGLDNPYADPPTARFLERAATEGLEAGAQALTLHALVGGGGRILATLGGAARDGRFCGALISYDPDPAIARCSPGQLLIIEAIRDLGARGFSTFDLGVGEARYKDSNCETDEPLFDAAVAVSAAGVAFAQASLLRQRLKRVIKQTPWARDVADRLRRRPSWLRAAEMRSGPAR